MALENLRSLQFSSSAALTISNHLERNDFSKTDSCSCTTYHCSDMNALRSQIITQKNKKFRFHLDISKQSSATNTSVLIGMGGSRAIRASDLHNTRTLCTCHSDVNETINTLDVRINSLGIVHSIESKSSALAEEPTFTSCNMCISGVYLSMTSDSLKNVSGKCLIGVDFHGLDLSGVNLGGSNFSNVDFSGQKLTNADIRQPIRVAGGYSWDWINSGVNFTNVDFSGCFMWGGYSYAAGWQCVPVTSNGFVSNNYTGADFRYAIFPASKDDWRWGTAPTASFTNDSLAYANFSGQKLAFFAAGSSSGCDLSEVGILPTNPDLYGIIMSNASVAWFNVVGDKDSAPHPVADHANFQNIIITSMDIYGGTPGPSLFTNYSIKSANFSGAHITRLSFNGSDLSGSNFTNATLHDCDFNGVNLTNVDFSGADLSGSDLFGADLTNVNWNNTTCPDGKNTGTNNTCAAVGFSCSSDTGDCTLQVPTGYSMPSTHAACTESCVQNKYLCNPDLGCDISAGGTPQTLNQCNASCVQNKYSCNPYLGTCSLNNKSGTQTRADCSNNCARICDASWTDQTYCTVGGIPTHTFIANIKTPSECETACGKKGSGCCTFVGGGGLDGCYWIEASSNPVRTTAPVAGWVTKVCKIPT